ncbi:MAG: ankyrin repeat domain-containing protein [Alphaproteobacteria bacterium]
MKFGKRNLFLVIAVITAVSAVAGIKVFQNQKEAVSSDKKMSSLDLELFDAIRNGKDVSAIEKIIKKGANVDVHYVISGEDAFSEKDETPLIAAINSKRDLEVIKLLLKYGADVENASNPNGYLWLTPLHIAILNNPDPKLVALLLEAKASVDYDSGEGVSPLIGASSINNPDIIFPIVKVSVNPQALNIMLSFASENNSPQIIGMLLEAGADINYQNCHSYLSAGETPLAKAVEGGNLEVMKLLIEKGADVNKVENCPQTDTMSHNLTPIMHAAKNIEAMDILIKAGADIKAKDQKGNSLLMYASRYTQDAEPVKQLLDLGLDANETNQDGEYAIDWAINSKSGIDVICSLIRAGANKSKNNEKAFLYFKDDCLKK